MQHREIHKVVAGGGIHGSVAKTVAQRPGHQPFINHYCRAPAP